MLQLIFPLNNIVFSFRHEVEVSESVRILL